MGQRRIGIGTVLRIELNGQITKVQVVDHGTRKGTECIEVLEGEMYHYILDNFAISKVTEDMDDLARLLKEYGL